MAIGYWLALLPMLLVFVGGIAAIRRFLRNPSPEWFMLLGLPFLSILALVHGCFLWPAGGTAKAFYVLPALVSFCAFGASGFDLARRRLPRFCPLLLIGMSVWALNTLASFWISGSSTERLISQAESLYAQAQYAPAIAVLKQGLLTKPADMKIRSLLVDWLLRTRNENEAAKQAEFLLQQDPASPIAHVALMIALADHDRLPQAIDHGWKAMDVAPGDVEVYEQLAKLLLRQGNYPEVFRVARQGIGMDPFSADLHCDMATALTTFQRDDEAISHLELASDLKPDWIVPHGLLGQILTVQNRLDEAATHYDRAAKLDPRNPAPHIDLGKVLALQGKFSEATNHLHEALRLEPTNQQAALELSAVLAKNPDAR
jgi:Flp pilus assembly protein TadD